jgi:hypothetical protein
MPRVPQVQITLAADGSLVAEFPTPNGLRRHVPIHDDTGIATIRRILAAQLSNRPQTIGTDAKPTTGQVNHWHKHLDQAGLFSATQSDPMCPWCIAAELGIDTTEKAYKRARAILTNERRIQSRRNFHYAGDGTIKVYTTANKSGKAKLKVNLDLASLLEDDDDDLLNGDEP